MEKLYRPTLKAFLKIAGGRMHIAYSAQMADNSSDGRVV